MTSDGFKDREHHLVFAIAPPTIWASAGHHLLLLLLVFFFCFNTWSLFLFDLKVLSPSACPFQVGQIKRSKLLMQFEPWRSRGGCSQTNRCRVLLLFCAYFAFLLQAVFLRRSTDRFKKPDQSFKSSFLPVQVKNHRMCALCRFSRLPLKASAFMMGSCHVCIFVHRAPAVLEVSSCPVWTSETSLRAHVGLQLLLKDRSMNQWSCEPEHRSGAFTCTARLL